MKLYSKVFLIYTVLLVGFILFFYFKHIPKIKECGTTVVQYDERRNVYFYEIHSSWYELLPRSYGPPIRVGMPISYVLYGDAMSCEITLNQVLSQEQWEAKLIGSCIGGCLIIFIVFFALGFGFWWAHWSEDANTITVPVVGDR